MRLEKETVKELLSNGTSMAMLHGVVSIGSIILQRAINGFEPAVITGVATGDKILTIIWIVLVSFENALIYFSSQNLGAGKPERIKRGVLVSFVFMAVIGGVSTAMIVPFGEPLFRMFVGGGTDADTLATLGIAAEYLNTQLAFFPFMASLCALRGAIKGMGVSIPTVACGVIELASRIGVSFANEISGIDAAVKLRVLYFAGPAAWVGASLFLALLIIHMFKKKKQAA